MSTQTPNRNLWKFQDGDDVEQSATTLLSANFDELDTHTHTAAEIDTGTLATGRMGAGTASNTTVLTGDQNWTDVSSKLALQDANNVAITGGSVTGITDVAVADGGTGASTAANARTNLGLGNVQNVDQTNASNLTSGTVAAARMGSGGGGSGLTLLSDDATFKSIGVWTSYTPTLTCPGGTDPTLGSGSHQFGRYIQIGKFVFVYFDVVFGSTGLAGGSGLYHVSIPVNCNTAGTSGGGISSEQLGHGLLLRGVSGDTLGPNGAHMHVAWHMQAGVNGSVVGVIPQQTPYDYQRALGTNADSCTAGASQDVTGCSATITVKQSNANYRIRAATPWYTSATPTITGTTASGTNPVAVSGTTAVDANVGPSLRIQIKEGSTVLAQNWSVAPFAGTSLGPQFPASVDTYIANPSLGSHTYKLTVIASDNSTIAYSSGNNQFPYIEVEQMPYNGAGEYVSDQTPWSWANSSIGAQMWGRLIYEAA